MITNTLENILVGCASILTGGIIIGFVLHGIWNELWERRKLNELRRKHRRLMNRILEYNLRIQDDRT